MTNIYHYRKPVIKIHGGKKVIVFYYRVPIEIRHLHKNREWERFIIRQDINKRGDQTDIYAEWFRSEVEHSLKNGYNPFAHELELVSNFEENTLEDPKELNATDAMQLFVDDRSRKGLDKTSFAKYKRVCNRFTEWLTDKHIPYIDIKKIKQDHIEAFLNDMKEKYSFGNREYNNHFTFLRTAFIFLVNKKHIEKSPMVGITKLKTKTKKHRYFDKETLNKIIRILELKDTKTLLAVQAVYYLCVRSEKELKHLKVGNILWEQNKILAQETKGGNERLIPMDENIKSILLKNDIDKYPPDYYIFGIDGKPSPTPFGKSYFAKRFRIICNEAGLSTDFTVYGFKHQRVCDLKQNNVPDADIMSLTGHTNYATYAIYLRGLGLTANIDNINKVSRKI